QPVEDGRERPFICDGLWRGPGSGGLSTGSESRRGAPPPAPSLPSPACGGGKGGGALSPQAGRGESCGRALDELEAYALLDRLGVPHAPSVALDVTTAPLPPLPFGYPVALKVLSSEITHKSDVGGVALGITDEPALLAAIAAMRTRLPQVQRVLV